MRRSYQKWAAEKRKESGPAPNWDGFVEACKQHFQKMLDDLDKQLEREDDEREAAEKRKQEETTDTEDDGAWESETPMFQDGMLQDRFWEEHWNLFRRCQHCGLYSYVNKLNELRSKGCRGCQQPNCAGNRPGGKKDLLKQLKNVLANVEEYLA